VPEQRRTATESWIRVQDPEPQPRPAPQRRPGETLDKVSSTAGLASNVADVGKAIPKIVAKIDPSDASRRAASFVGKTLGPISTAMSLAETQSAYMADIRRGMPKDEAFVKNFGRAGMKYAGAAMGAGIFITASGPAAPVGVVLGGALGAKVGENASNGLLPLYQGGKQGFKLTAAGAKQLLKNMEAVEKFKLPAIPELTNKYYIDRLYDRRELGNR